MLQWTQEWRYLFEILISIPRIYSQNWDSVQSLSHVRLLQSHEPQHARPSCPSPTPQVHPNPCPLSQWCHPTISSSVMPFSFHPQSFPASSNESVLCIRWPKYWSLSFKISPSNEYPGLISLGWTGWISLQSKGLSRVFSNTTVQKHQFFSSQLSSQSNSHIHTWLLEKP